VAFAKRTPEEVLSLVQAEGIEIVDFRFSDLPGLMQHYSMPAHELTLDSFEEGSGFDGSSIRGFQEIQESDMLLVPDPNTAVIDPFRQHKTLNLNCFVRDPVTGESYSRDPRYVAKKAEDYLVSTGHRRHRLLRARSRVLHLQRHPLRPELSTRASTRSTRSRESGTRARTRGRTSGSSPATRRATSRSRPWTTSRTCAPR
jgi:hypothetical protein